MCGKGICVNLGGFYIKLYHNYRGKENTAYRIDGFSIIRYNRPCDAV